MKINGVLFSDTNFDFKFTDYNINIISLRLKNIKNNIFYDKDVVFLNLSNNNNLEYIKYIRYKNPNIPIIIIGQEIDFKILKDYVHFGIFDYIINPVDKTYFDYTIKRLLKTICFNYIEKDKFLFEFYNDVILSSKDKMYFSKCINNISDKKENNYIMENLKIWFLSDFPWTDYYIDIEDYNTLEEFITELHNIVLKFNLDTKEGIINKICNCVFDNIESNKIFDRISENLELTKDYIGKIFKAQTKITVNEYIQRMKIGYSKKIIKSESFKLYEICEKIGYSSTDYFTKMFKKYTGETPSEYRKRILNL